MRRSAIRYYVICLPKRFKRSRYLHCQRSLLAKNRSNNVFDFDCLECLRYHPSDPLNFPDGRSRRRCFGRSVRF